MSRAQSKAAMVETSYKVGDPIDLGAGNGYIRYPDGSTATSRGTFTPTAPGVYVLVVDTENGQVETEVTVTKAATDA